MTGFTVAGVDDTWMLIERAASEGIPLVVRVRDNEALRSLAEHRPTMIVSAIVPDHELAANLMLSAEWSERLYAFEESLLQQLENDAPTTYQLGAITGNGRREFYFSATDADKVRVIAAQVGQSFDLILQSSEIEAQDCWRVLVPTALDRQLNGDRNVIERLLEEGDDVSVPRETEFWFYGDSVGLAAVAEDLAPAGYGSVSWLEETSGMTLKKVTSTQFVDFEAITPQLLAAAERHGVTYDGWETFVVRPIISLNTKSSLLDRLFGKPKI